MPTVKDYERFLDPDEDRSGAHEKENFLRQKWYVKEKRAALAEKRKRKEGERSDIKPKS